MSGDEPKARPKAEPPKLAEVVSLPSAMAAEQPAELSAPEALKVVRLLAADTANIVVHPYGARRAKERRPPHHSTSDRAVCAKRNHSGRPEPKSVREMEDELLPTR